MLVELGRHRLLRCAQLERERDQPLLRTVVQIALDPPARCVGGRHDSRADASTSARLSAFAMAVPISSVKSVRRASVV